MILKKMLLFTVMLFSLSISAQNKVFAFSQIQSRNDIREWGKVECIDQQLVHFTPEQIDLKIDKKYHLTIVTKTDLPDNGVIYLCNDEKSNPVTVMLIDDSKMFVYSKTKRFKINLDPMKSTQVLADTD